MTISKFRKFGVSNHGIVRWLERIEEIDIARLRTLCAADGWEAEEDGLLIGWLRHARKIDTHTLRVHLTRIVQTCVEANPADPRLGDHKLILSKHGKLITILQPEMRRSDKRKHQDVYAHVTQTEVDTALITPPPPS